MENESARDLLRRGRSASLKRLRYIGALSALGVVDFAVISLYQMGLIRHLPDPPGRFFDSDTINASPEAYPFGIPDGTIGATVYASNLVLASTAAREGRTRRTASLALGLSVVVQAAGAVYYLYDMVVRQRKLCAYCLLGTLINFVMLPLSIRESRDERASRDGGADGY